MTDTPHGAATPPDSPPHDSLSARRDAALASAQHCWQMNAELKLLLGRAIAGTLSESDLVRATKILTGV